MNKTLKDALKTASTKGLELLKIFDEKKKKEVIIKNTENVYRILKNYKDFQGRIRLNVFKNALEIQDKLGWRQIQDVDDIIFQTRLSVLFPFLFMVGKEMVHDAIIRVAKECEFNPPKDYMESQKWDKIPRLDTWLSSAYGVEDTEYHRAVGSNWLKGLVHRTIVPGCKFDYVLVLIGKQGIKKSTSLSKLVTPEWHLEQTDTPNNKDFFEQMRGKLVIEFSEGESVSKSDAKKLKSVITSLVDTYRPSYGHYAEDFPRRCVFAMTTNQEEFLKDDTGNRRWLPVVCREQINIEWIGSNRDQLFAEAYYRVITKKETTWEFPQEATEAAQEEARIKDPSTDIIVEWYDKLGEYDKKRGITTQQVYKTVLNSSAFGIRPMNKYEEMQIATILRITLNLKKDRSMIDGLRITRWYRQEDPIPTHSLMSSFEKEFEDLAAKKQ